MRGPSLLRVLESIREAPAAGRAWVASLLGLLLVAACTGPASGPAGSTSPVYESATGQDNFALKGGETRLTLLPGASEARYRAREQLVGRTLPSDAVGSTTDVGGSIVLDSGGASVAERSRIAVDLRSLRSDESRRDNWIQRNTLETSRFPNADFAVEQVSGLPSPLPATGQASFQMLGNLTVHGVSRPVTWETTATFAADSVSGTATTDVTMTEFGMAPPRVGPVLSIEDGLKLEVEFRAVREYEPGAASGRQVAGEPSSASASFAARSGLAQPIGACVPTRADQLGPFYTPNAPMRTSVGGGYVLSGTVRSAESCEPIPDALIEFWLANPQAVYDDDHRASMLSGPEGEYRFESNVPVRYPGRPPHIHVRVSAPGFQTLVTQHYPGPGQTEALFDLVLVRP